MLSWPSEVRAGPGDGEDRDVEIVDGSRREIAARQLDGRAAAQIGGRVGAGGARRILEADQRHREVVARRGRDSAAVDRDRRHARLVRLVLAEQRRRRAGDIEQIDIAAADVSQCGMDAVQVARDRAAEMDAAGARRELDLRQGWPG